MSILQALILGTVQGLTEFLPVSSSGHLVLANYYLGYGATLPLWVDIATNTGTLLAVLLALRSDVWMAARGFLVGLASPSRRGEEGWRLAILVLTASIPTVVIGLGLRSVFERLNAPLPVSIALILTGVILWFTPTPGKKDSARQLSFWDAILAGLAQGLAVIPGISRSGTTIAAMLWRGSSANLAPRFSFLMYLVVSSGVALLGIGEIHGSELELAPLIVMTITSFITGYLAILWLLALLRRGRFRYFAPYLWGIALLTILGLAVR